MVVTIVFVFSESFRFWKRELGNVEKCFREGGTRGLLASTAINRITLRFGCILLENLRERLFRDS